MLIVRFFMFIMFIIKYRSMCMVSVKAIGF